MVMQMLTSNVPATQASRPEFHPQAHIWKRQEHLSSSAETGDAQHLLSCSLDRPGPARLPGRSGSKTSVESLMSTTGYKPDTEYGTEHH